MADVQINASDVMKLRDRTGMQMMKCKAALIQAGGDMEKALEIIRLENKNAQIKTADRETTEGRIGIFIDGSIGAIVELRCESAPVAKNELFLKLANDVAKHIAAKKPGSPADLLNQPFVDAPTKSVNDRIGEVVGLMRENIKPQRLSILEGTLATYIHHDGSVGVLLAVEGTPKDVQVLKDVCMHIAAANPLVALREHVSPERLAKEKELAKLAAEEQGKNKPANIIEKIAEGKLNTWLASNVLNDQPFVKDETKTVGALLSATGVKLKNFVRYKVGEVSY
ncbi:MAG: translation elongation factor Ts [Planctomycetia bacterium]|nr:translation elongation factor Ts [Planctomycetia bacterium]